MSLPLDYETLRVIWWLLLGILIMGFAVMDGFDLGVGVLLPYVSRTNLERRIVLNTVGPVWEGNQIWLILGGGAIFAAWPALYAMAFSGFYFAMLLVLLALILRPVGFKYRSKVENTRWGLVWDIALFVGGFVPSLVFGVAMGNVLQGVPFHFDDDLRGFYTGTFWELLNPFALLCGLLSVSLLSLHGASFLGIKTEGLIQLRASRYLKISAIASIVLFALGGIWLFYAIPGYQVVSHLVHAGPSNPLHKQVAVEMGAWFHNFINFPILLLVPVLGFLGMLGAFFCSLAKSYKLAWVSSAIAITFVIATVGTSMFPFILPSSSHPECSLLVWDASSSHLTLFIMLIAAIIFVPIILAYTSWVYYVLRGKMTEKIVQANDKSYY